MFVVKLGFCLSIAYIARRRHPYIESLPVRVLLRHSVVVNSPKRIVINHIRLFTIRFGTSVPKSKSGSYISLFVLELPLPNRKAEVKFHYLFWNFRSQIEKRKLIGQNKLSLAVRCTFAPFRRRRQSKRIVISHTPLFTIRFGTSVPKSKSGS